MDFGDALHAMVRDGKSARRAYWAGKLGGGAGTAARLVTAVIDGEEVPTLVVSTPDGTKILTLGQWDILATDWEVVSVSNLDPPGRPAMYESWDAYRNDTSDNVTGSSTE